MSENNTNPMPADLLNQILGELRRTNARFDRLETRFGELEEKVEAAQRGTRPIWENVLQRLDSIEKDLTEFKKQTHKDFQEIKRSLRYAEGDIADLDLRLTALEEKNEPQQ